MHLGIPEANLSPGREVTLQGAPAQRAAPPQSSGNHVLSEGWGRGPARQLKLGAAPAGSILGDSRVCATPGEPRAPLPPRGRVRLARYLRTRLAPPPLPGRVRPPGGSRASSLGEAGLWTRVAALPSAPASHPRRGRGRRRGGGGGAGRGSNQCPRLRCSFARRSRGRRAARSPPTVPWHSPAPRLSAATSVRSWASRSWGSWTAPAWLCPPRPSWSWRGAAAAAARRPRACGSRSRCSRPWPGRAAVSWPTVSGDRHPSATPRPYPLPTPPSPSVPCCFDSLLPEGVGPGVLPTCCLRFLCMSRRASRLRPAYVGKALF